MKAHHPVQTLCAVFDVSASGYYDWRSRLANPGPRARQNQALAQTIKTVHATSRQTYGSPRIQIELRKQGARHGRNRIARIMRQQGLCGRQKARYRVRTTDSNHDEPIAPNRLAQTPAPSRPNQIWVAEITYIGPARAGNRLMRIERRDRSERAGWRVGVYAAKPWKGL